MASSSFKPHLALAVHMTSSLVFVAKILAPRFTDHLCKALKDERIRVFRDDSDLERGKMIWTELVQAIKTSRIAVIVFSKICANSKWCFDELVVIMDCRSSTSRCECNQTLTVLPIFYEVFPSDVREQKGNFAEVLPNFPEDTVKKWKEALTESAKLSGFPLKKDSSESKSIEQIVEFISKTLYSESLSAAPAGSESKGPSAIIPDASPQRTTKANKCACSFCVVITLCIVVLFSFIGVVITVMASLFK